jgi:hypothetical protein
VVATWKPAVATWKLVVATWKPAVATWKLVVATWKPAVATWELVIATGKHAVPTWGLAVRTWKLAKLIGISEQRTSSCGAAGSQPTEALGTLLASARWAESPPLHWTRSGKRDTARRIEEIIRHGLIPQITA